MDSSNSELENSKRVITTRRIAAVDALAHDQYAARNVHFFEPMSDIIALLVLQARYSSTRMYPCMRFHIRL
mgnify:FL=1